MKGRIRFCLIGVAGCLVLAAVWAVLAVPGTAVADKPTGGKHNHDKGDDDGGGDTGNQPCVIFDDTPGDSVQSDVQENPPCCVPASPATQLVLLNNAWGSG